MVLSNDDGEYRANLHAYALMAQTCMCSLSMGMPAEMQPHCTCSPGSPWKNEKPPVRSHHHQLKVPHQAVLDLAFCQGCLAQHIAGSSTPMSLLERVPAGSTPGSLFSSDRSQRPGLASTVWLVSKSTGSSGRKYTARCVCCRFCLAVARRGCSLKRA